MKINFTGFPTTHLPDCIYHNGNTLFNRYLLMFSMCLPISPLYHDQELLNDKDLVKFIQIEQQGKDVKQMGFPCSFSFVLACCSSDI